MQNIPPHSTFPDLNGNITRGYHFVPHLLALLDL